MNMGNAPFGCICLHVLCRPLTGHTFIEVTIHFLNHSCVFETKFSLFRRLLIFAALQGFDVRYVPVKQDRPSNMDVNI